jgi:Tfp pilus assembly protein PilN
MQDAQHLITPEHHQLWTVVGFILAMLALALALTGLYRTSMVTVVSQAQIMVLNQKVEALTAKLAKGSDSAEATAKKP